MGWRTDPLDKEVPVGIDLLGELDLVQVVIASSLSEAEDSLVEAQYPPGHVLDIHTGGGVEEDVNSPGVGHLDKQVR